MRLIDADNLKERVWRLNVGAREFISQMIDDTPTVDAEPMRHGLWNPKIIALGTMVFKCSECQKYSDVHWAYCSYCGAKMDGGEDGR